MKRWSQFSHNGLTMTVAELRAKLAEYPDDAPVVLGYEGVENDVGPNSFRVVTAEAVKSGERYSLEGCVLIDAECGSGVQIPKE